MWPCHFIVNLLKFKPDFVGLTYDKYYRLQGVSLLSKNLWGWMHKRLKSTCTSDIRLILLHVSKEKQNFLVERIFVHLYFVLAKDRLNLPALNWWKSDLLEYFSGDLNCSALEFACSNRCIPLTWQCDGDIDCPAGEDESDCCEYC